MFHVCLICNKNNMAKEILTQLQVLLGISSSFGQSLTDGTISLAELAEANGLFKYQIIKILLEKIELTLVRNQEWGVGALKTIKDQVAVGNTSVELTKRKIQRDLHSGDKPSDIQYIRIWLRTVCLMQLSKIFTEKRLGDLVFYNFKLQSKLRDAKSLPRFLPIDYDFNTSTIDPMELITSYLDHKRSFTIHLINEQIKKLTQSLEYVCSHLFEHCVTLRTQFGLVSDIEFFARNRFMNISGKVFTGTYFFPNDSKFRDFSSTMDLQTYMVYLQDHHLSLVKTKPGGDTEVDFYHDASNPLSAAKDLTRQSNDLLAIKTDKARAPDMSAGIFKKSSLLSPEDKTSGGGVEAYVNSKL